MFLKNRNIISNIKRSKVTDYAALSQIYASVGSFFISINEATLIKLFTCDAISQCLCRMFIQMIEAIYIPTYMKLNYISTVSKGRFLCHLDFGYIANTIILYTIEHCINVLCLFSSRNACVNFLRHLCVA